MEIKLLSPVLILSALTSFGFAVSEPKVPLPFVEHPSVLLSIPSANVIRHGQYRLSGRFQYFTSAEVGSNDTTFVDPNAAGTPKDVQSLNYSSELLFGIENRAEIGIQYGQLFSASIKALLVREDLIWPDMVFGVRNLFGSQEGGLYGVSNPKTQKNLESESFVTLAKSLGIHTRMHLGMSVLTHATKGFGSVNAGVEQNLGAGAYLGYEVFERFSDFHQVLSLEWKYKNIVAFNMGMTEFQSWIRQGGRWGFFLTPSHSLADGYNSPGITFSLHVSGWVPHREMRTIPERVAILEVKNAQLERDLEYIQELKRQVADLKAGTLGIENGEADDTSVTQSTDKAHLPGQTFNKVGKPISKASTDMALIKLKSVTEKMQSDLSDPKEIRELMSQIISLGPTAVESLKHTALDSSAGSLRVPAILVMGYSKDTTYLNPLKITPRGTESACDRPPSADRAQNGSAG